MGTAGKRRESDYDDVSASTKKQKNSYLNRKLTQLQNTRAVIHQATSQVNKKRMQAKDRKENQKKTVKTPSPPRTIQIEDSKQESSSYRNQSNSVRSNSTSTSSKSHHNTLSTFTPSTGKVKQYDLAMINMEQQYTAKIKQLEEKIKQMETSKKNTKKKGEPIVSEQFQGFVKHIAKYEIYPRVKFISSEKTLRDWKNQNSIGKFFLKKFHEGVLKSQYHIDEKMNDEEIWQNSKDIVYDMIRQKRGSVQTEIKKAFKGAYYFTFKNEFTRTNTFA